MKALRGLLIGAVSLAGLVLVALAALLVVVDGNFVKSRLEQEMKEKNRTLRIEGTPAVSLFPVARLSLGKTTLSEPGSEKLFLSLDAAEAAVRVVPLLSGEIAIESLKLANLKATLVRRKDGSMNFSDLAGRAHGQERTEKEPLPALRIAGVSVEGVQVTFHDEASGQQLTLAELNLKAGRLDGATPGEVELSARWSGKRPDVDLRAQVSGALSFNLRKDEFAFDRFTAQLKGRIDQETVAAEFAAPKVTVGASRAAGSAIQGSLQLKGPQRSLDLSYTVSMAGPPLTADVLAKLDGSTVKAKIALPDLAPLKAHFDFSADKLDLDRYFPPARRDASPSRSIDLSGLKGKTVTGKAAIGLLVYRHARLENVMAEVKLAGGKLEIAPYSANLYGGTLAGELSADANGNKIHVKETAQNVAVGALLRDVTQRDFLEGRGNVALDVQTAGGTTIALKKALAGSARVEMKEGAIKGINLAEAVRKPGGAQKTEFSNLSASLKIRDGVARNDDLKAHSPLLDLTGAGNLDIGNNSIDYVARASLTRGVAVPVKLYGALDSPSYSVDYTGLAGAVVGGAVAGPVGAAAGTAIQNSAGGVTDKLRGLFKR